MNLKENKWSREEEELLKTGLYPSQLEKHPLLIANNRTRGAIRNKILMMKVRALKPPKPPKPAKEVKAKPPKVAKPVAQVKKSTRPKALKEDKTGECSRPCRKAGVCDLTCERKMLKQRQAMHQERERGYPM